MAEPRARLRSKGQQFSSTDIEAILVSFGDDDSPLPSTISVLDEILTDFIIETCHNAALCASYSRRQKIKVDDFRWVLRRDSKKLGRVGEMYIKAGMLKENRKVLGGLDFGAAGQPGKNMGDLVGGLEEGETKGKKKRKRPKTEE